MQQAVTRAAVLALAPIFFRAFLGGGAQGAVPAA